MTFQGHGNEVPPLRGQVRAFSVKTGSPTLVRFLGNYTGMLQHWKTDRISFACSGPHSCPKPLHSLKTTWKGYAPAERWNDVKRLWIPVACEITANLDEELAGEELRGLVYRLERERNADGAFPVTAVLFESHVGRKLREPFDVRVVVQRIYPNTEIWWGAVNTLPKRIILEALAGDAPGEPFEMPFDVRKADYRPSIVELEAQRRERERKAAPSKNGEHHANGTTK